MAKSKNGQDYACLEQQIGAVLTCMAALIGLSAAIISGTPVAWLTFITAGISAFLLLKQVLTQQTHQFHQDIFKDLSIGDWSYREGQLSIDPAWSKAHDFELNNTQLALVKEQIDPQNWDCLLQQIEGQNHFSLCLKMTSDAFNHNWRWFQISGIVLARTDSQVLVAKGILEEVTNLQQTQEQKNLDIKQQEIGHLVSQIAQRYRNIADDIEPQLEILQHPINPSEQRSALLYIKNHIQKIQQFTERLQRINGDLPIEKTEFQLSDLLMRIQRISPLILPSQISFSVLSLDHDLLLEGNETLFLLMLCHLIINARNALVNEGSITLEINEIPNTELELTIRDTGPGLPSPLRDCAFLPYQTDENGNKITKLGLAIAKGIARAHQGRLELKSLPSGAEITLLLPIQPQVSTEPEETLFLPTIAPQTDSEEVIILGQDTDYNCLLGSILSVQGYSLVAFESLETLSNYLLMQNRVISHLFIDAAHRPQSVLGQYLEIKRLLPATSIIVLSDSPREQLDTSHSNLLLLSRQTATTQPEKLSSAMKAAQDFNALGLIDEPLLDSDSDEASRAS